MTPDAAQEVLARIVGRVAPEVDLEGVDPSAPIQQELDLDSMDFLNLMAELHDEAAIDVPERDYPLLSSIAGFVDYVAAHATG